MLDLHVGRRGWPHRVPEAAALPPRFADGRPWPLISIVTPSFNQGRYIEDSILSVLHQNYPAVELIIIDACSTDETSQVLEAYRSRVAHVVRERDEGQSDGINKGMALARGDIVTWLNADDLLAPGALAAMATAFLTSGADVVAGGCAVLHDEAIAHVDLPATGCGPLPLREMVDLRSSWNIGRFFSQPATFYTRRLWDEVGGLRKDLHMAMDYDLWLKFAEADARLHVIGAPVAIFRRHAEQKTFTFDAAAPETEALAGAVRKRHGWPPEAPPSPVPAAGRNLRVVTLHDAPPDYLPTPLARLHEALADGWAEVAAVHVGDGRPTGQLPLETWQGRILSRISWQNPDVVVAARVAEDHPLAPLLAAVARRWPLVQVPVEGGECDDLLPAVPRAFLRAPLCQLQARRRLNLPRAGVVVGATPGLRGVLADAGVAKPFEVDAERLDDEARRQVFAAIDILVAGPVDGQLMAEAAAQGVAVIAYGGGGLAALNGWPAALAPAEHAAALGDRLAILCADPAGVRDIGRVASLIVANEFSSFSVYRRFYLNLRERGVIARLGLKDKVDFRPSASAPRPSLPGWPGL